MSIKNSSRPGRWCTDYSEFTSVVRDVPITIAPEMLEFTKVLQNSANKKKYPADNWLQEDGINSDHKAMHDSMFHHLAKSFSNQRIDNDSGLDHLLHLAMRALMLYTRISRKIVHPKDKS